MQEIENLSKKVDQLKFDQKQSDSDGLDMNTDEVQKLRMKASRSVHEICNLNEHLELSDNKQYLACLPCTKALTAKCPV